MEAGELPVQGHPELWGEKGTLPSCGDWWGAHHRDELTGKLDELKLCLVIPEYSVASQTGPGVEVGNPVFSVLKDYPLPCAVCGDCQFPLKNTCGYLFIETGSQYISGWPELTM